MWSLYIWRKHFERLNRKPTTKTLIKLFHCLACRQGLAPLRHRNICSWSFEFLSYYVTYLYQLSIWTTYIYLWVHSRLTLDCWPESLNVFERIATSINTKVNHMCTITETCKQNNTLQKWSRKSKGSGKRQEIHLCHHCFWPTRMCLKPENKTKHTNKRRWSWLSNNLSDSHVYYSSQYLYNRHRWGCHLDQHKQC